MVYQGQLRSSQKIGKHYVNWDKNMDVENIVLATVYRNHYWQSPGVNNVFSYPGVKKIGKWIFKIFTLLQFWGKFHFFDFWGNGGRWGNFFLPQLIIYLG